MKRCIIPCSKEKYWDEHPDAGAVFAKDAYTSGYYKLCRKYAEEQVGDYVILSAKYGFLAPHDKIEGTYDVTFSRPDDPVVTDVRLIEQSAHWQVTELLLLLPHRYEARVRSAMRGRNLTIECPFTGITDYDVMSDWLIARLD